MVDLDTSTLVGTYPVWVLWLPCTMPCPVDSICGSPQNAVKQTIYVTAFWECCVPGYQYPGRYLPSVGTLVTLHDAPSRSGPVDSICGCPQNAVKQTIYVTVF